ncbi:MAG: hypothetical protein ACPGUU_02415 [Flavobacteriaceae bacterium]
MKNTFLLLIIALFITSCSNSDDSIIDNPLENTTWEYKYFGQISLSFDTSSYSAAEIKDILDKYMFTAKAGTGYVENNSTSNYFFTSSDQSSYKQSYNFEPTTNLVGNVNDSFLSLESNNCQKSDYYDYTLTTVDRPDYIAQIGKSKFARKVIIDSKHPNKLYIYSISNFYGKTWIGFDVYEKIDKTSVCLPDSTNAPLPTPDFLTGTWNLDLVYTSGNDPLGKIVIDKFELEADSFTKYILTGKFQEIDNGQITEYTFNTSESYYDDSTKSMVIQASNGTDTFNFYGKIDQIDNKWKGLLGENSVRINQETLGDFIGEKQ